MNFAKRKEVQNLEYCGRKLCESRDVHIYLDFKVRLMRINERITIDEEKTVFAKGQDNFEILVTSFAEKATDIVKAYYDACIAYGFSEEIIENMVDLLIEKPSVKEATDMLDKYEAEYAEVLQDQEQIAAYREMKKELRGRWVGGGTGVAGSLKGAAFAYGMNAASGAAYSVSNAIGNKVTKSQNEKKLIAISEKYKPKLFASLRTLMHFFELSFVENANAAPFAETVIYYYDEEIRNDQPVIFEMLPGGKELDNIVRYINAIPYWTMFYKAVLKEFGDENGNLSKFANAYDVHLSGFKSEILYDFSTTLDICSEACIEEYMGKEAFLSHHDPDVLDELCGRYILNRLGRDLSVQNVNEIVQQMEELSVKYGYHPGKEKKLLKNILLEDHKIDIHTDYKEQLLKYIPELEHMDSGYSVDFSGEITIMKDHLKQIEDLEEKLRKKAEEEQRKKDIAARTVCYIVEYSVREKDIKTETLLLDSKEEVDAFDKKSSKVRELCSQLSFDLSIDEWNRTINEIDIFCSQNNYPAEQLLRSLKNAFAEEDKKIRTFSNYEYPTREDAAFARQEAEAMKQIDRETSDSNVERLRRYLQGKFSSKYALDKIQTLEKLIVRGYQRKDTDKRDYIVSTAVSGPAFILAKFCSIAWVLFAVIGVVCFFTLSKLLAILLLAIAGGAYKLRDVLDDASIPDRKPDNYSDITVVDGKIMWKNTCPNCYSKLSDGAKFCEKCGSKVKK